MPQRLTLPSTREAHGGGVDERVGGEQGIDLRFHVVDGRNDVEEILDDAKIEIDAEERGEVLQGKMLNNAGATLLQQLIAFAGCGASVRSMRSRIKGWERYVNKENTENMKKEGRKVPEM